MIKPYKKESEISYASGAYATYELLRHRPSQVEAVFIHPSFTDAARLEAVCVANGIYAEYSEKAFRRINQKENCYAAGVFRKYENTPSPDKPHAVFVNPGDFGNLGSAIRTLVGFNIRDIAVILPGADLWHPKTIRASMGAVFQTETAAFASFDEYRGLYERHKIFSFMLDGRTELSAGICPLASPYALVFGNEAAGLPAKFHELGESVRIPQSEYIDSFNVTAAIGIGAYVFACANGQLQRRGC
jgi:TrmH family RNA methyltransferase